jgi:hypothetical protein
LKLIEKNITVESVVKYSYFNNHFHINVNYITEITMKWIIFSFLVTFYLNSNIYSQQVTAEIYDPPIPYHGQFDVWGTDYLVTNTEPLGRPSGVYRTTNNTIYVAVPDTNLTAGRCVVIFASSNNGVSWVSTGSVSPALVVRKSKWFADRDLIQFIVLYS